VRLIAIIATVGVAVGIGLAALVHAVQGPVHSTADEPCTAEWLHLAPTLSLNPAGTTLTVGFQTPVAGGCRVPQGERFTGVRIESADGMVLLAKRVEGGPPPGSAVTAKLVYSVTTPAAPICRAPQPLHFQVWVIGLTASGETSLRFDGGRCVYAS
jgi:hypothetical protein